MVKRKVIVWDATLIFWGNGENSGFIVRGDSGAPGWGPE